MIWYINEKIRYDARVESWTRLSTVSTGDKEYLDREEGEGRRIRRDRRTMEDQFLFPFYDLLRLKASSENVVKLGE